MPQMSPLLWLNLYGFFILVFMLIIISNFFIKIPTKMSVDNKKREISSFQWKW